MNSNCLNIYKTARKSSGLIQDRAAELLNVSARSVVDYESGKTIPADDVVCTMIEIYKCPWLAYEHMRQSSEVGRRYLPEIEHTDLAKTVLRFQKEVGDINQINRDMIEVVCDGVIDQSERNRWGDITREIREMAGAALSVIFAGR